MNRARSFIYSTAPPPAVAHASIASLGLIRSAEGDALRKRLRENIDLLAPGHPSPVFPRILGESTAALTAARQMEDRGFLVPAIRYPTVPRGTARLRISLSATHPAEIVAGLRKELADLTP